MKEVSILVSEIQTHARNLHDAAQAMAETLESIALGGCESDGDWSGCREHYGDEQTQEWCTPCKANHALSVARFILNSSDRSGKAVAASKLQVERHD